MQHPQSFFLSAGNEACYALQLFHVAQKLGYAENEQAALEVGIRCGAVEFHAENCQHPRNFTVLDAGKFISELTGKKYAVRWETPEYKPKDGEHVIKFYAKTAENAAKGIGHFDSDDYHTLQSSLTVKTGRVYSTRVVYPSGRK